MACFLVEFKLWEAQLKAEDTPGDFAQSGVEDINGKEFAWSYDAKKLKDSELLRLDFKTSWNEKGRSGEYSLDFFTYLFKESAVP
jgi:hypothetical protein